MVNLNELFNAIVAGEMTLDQFEAEWDERRQNAYDNGYDAGYDAGQAVNDGCFG